MTHTGSPLLVLAGAGSGKTKVLTYRAIYLINALGVDPSEVVLLTFTNKAAAEMKSRVERLGGTDTTLGFAGTFHTFCARSLRIYGHLVSVAQNFVIYDAEDSERAIKTAIKELGLDPKTNKPGMFAHLISRLKNDLMAPEEVEVAFRDEFYTKLVAIWRKYQAILSQANAVDFDDLLVKTAKLLSLPETKEKFKRKHKYVLVDEYQDTNKVQFVLTKLLAEGNPAGLMVVGDAAQAIYSFRGADFRNLSLLASEYSNLTTIKLPKNYRSTQTILDAAYGVIANNRNHPILKLEADKEIGEKIEVAELIDEREEAAYVVKQAERLALSGGSLAVLYRTNAQSRAIEEELIRRRIDYKLIGGIRFYDRAEIKDLLAYLRVIYNEADLICWQRIEALGKRKKAVFEEWLSQNRTELLSKSAQEILVEVMLLTEYQKQFDERDEEDAARIENIKELLAVAGEFKTVAEFLESVALVQSDELAERKNGTTLVTMMTIHAAKGLEFDEVIVVGLEEGLLPHSRSLLAREELEEERRLLYVAMTRAREKLHLTYTRSRLVFGGRQGSSPSRFLTEIPLELVKLAGEMVDKNEYRREETGLPEERRVVLDWETEPTPISQTRGRRRVSQEELAKETADDFAEIDAW